MKFAFRIPPFGNWTVSEGVVEQISLDTSNDPILGRIMGNNEQFRVNHYKTGETKAMFSIPVKSKTGIFHSAFPDPILLYLSAAHRQYEESEKIKNEWFPKHAIKDLEGNDNWLDSNVDETNEVYNLYIQCRVGALIMLHATIEAFVNDVIPDDISFPYTDKNGHTKTLIKSEVEWLSFVDKVSLVAPFISTISPSIDTDVMNKVVFIAQKRNEFIHLKSEIIDGFKTSYTGIFHDMLKLNLVPYFEAAHKFIEKIKPGYIKYI